MKMGKSIFINKAHKWMPNCEYIFTSFSSAQLLGRHIIALLNMNILRHDLEGMDTNISKVWRRNNKSLSTADKKDTGLQQTFNTVGSQPTHSHSFLTLDSSLCNSN